MNCIIVDDDEQIRLVMETLVKASDSLHLVKSCSTGIEAANVLLKEKIDLIFLDVIMPGMSGMEFLQSLEGEKPLIIMVTGNKESAAEAYDFEVCDFILKPITHSRFLKAVSKAKKLIGATAAQSAKNTFFVKYNSILVKINMEDIFLVEALADYIAVHTAKQKYIVHSTMKDVLNKLPKNDYIRVHNSYIVRVDKIASIEGNTLSINKQLVPISRAKQKDLMNRIELLN